MRNATKKVKKYRPHAKCGKKGEGRRATPAILGASSWWVRSYVASLPPSVEKLSYLGLLPPGRPGEVVVVVMVTLAYSSLKAEAEADVVRSASLAERHPGPKNNNKIGGEKTYYSPRDVYVDVPWVVLPRLIPRCRCCRSVVSFSSLHGTYRASSLG